MSDELADVIVDAVVRFVRDEAERLVKSGSNWKLTLNGSAGGNVRGVSEMFSDIRVERQVNQST